MKKLAALICSASLALCTIAGDAAPQTPENTPAGEGAREMRGPEGRCPKRGPCCAKRGPEQGACRRGRPGRGPEEGCRKPGEGRKPALLVVDEKTGDEAVEAYKAEVLAKIDEAVAKYRAGTAGAKCKSEKCGCGDDCKCAPAGRPPLKLEFNAGPAMRGGHGMRGPRGGGHGMRGPCGGGHGMRGPRGGGEGMRRRPPVNDGSAPAAEPPADGQPPAPEAPGAE